MSHQSPDGDHTDSDVVSLLESARGPPPDPDPAASDAEGGTGSAQAAQHDELTASKSDTPPFSWSLLVPLYGITVVQELSRGTDVLLPSFLSTDYGLDDLVIGIVVAGNGAGSVVGNLIAGGLASKVPFKALLYLMLVLYILGSLLYIFPLALTAILGSFLRGVSFAIFHNCRMVFFSETVPSESRGKANSLTGGLTRWVNTFGPLCAGFLAELTSMRAVFVSQAGLVLLCIPFIIALRFGSVKSVAQTERASVIHTYKQLCRQYWRVLLVAGGFSLVLSGLRSARNLLVSLKLLEDKYSTSLSGAVLSVMLVCDAVLFFLSGILIDNYGRKFSGAPACLLLGTGCLMLALSTSVALVFVSASVLGLANAISSGLVMVIGQDISPKVHRGEFQSLYQLLVYVATFATPVVVGSLCQGWSVMVGSLVFAGIGLFGTLWMVFVMPETLKKKKKMKPAAEAAVAAEEETAVEIELKEADKMDAPNGHAAPNGGALSAGQT